MFHQRMVSMLSKVSGSCLQDYGEVPAYLQWRIEARQRVQEKYENFVKEQQEQQIRKIFEEQQDALEVLKPRLPHWSFLSVHHGRSGFTGRAQYIKQTTSKLNTYLVLISEDKRALAWWSCAQSNQTLSNKIPNLIRQLTV